MRTPSVRAAALACLCMWELSCLCLCAGAYVYARTCVSACVRECESVCVRVCLVRVLCKSIRASVRASASAQRGCLHVRAGVCALPSPPAASRARAPAARRSRPRRQAPVAATRPAHVDPHGWRPAQPYEHRACVRLPERVCVCGSGVACACVLLLMYMRTRVCLACVRECESVCV